MDPLDLCIIGFGPRGLITFSEIIFYIRKHNIQNPVNIHIVDPAEPGEGCHSAKQPSYLYTNTLASQVTMFRPTVDGEGASQDEPSFTDWARQMGYRKVGNEFLQAENSVEHSEDGFETRPIDDFDYLPRSLLGAYLSWVFEKKCSQMPVNCQVIHHQGLAQEISQDDDNCYSVSLEKSRSVKAKYIFLSTGHSTNKSNKIDVMRQNFTGRHKAKREAPNYIRQVYPVSVFNKIEANSVIAIQGLGLTAWDVLAELTEGRGGRFIETKNRLKYVRSNREPKIVLFSRQCLPSTARGFNQKGLTGRHKPHFFTSSAVEKLKAAQLAKSGSRKLDFRDEVLPLLEKEMAYAYRQSLTNSEVDIESFEMSNLEKREIDNSFDPLRMQRFDTLSDYKEFFINLVEQDLIEAHKGNLSSPLKAATDVIRDTRSILCEAVERNGLTPESHQWFIENFVPIINRVAYGPPLFRNQQLLALMEDGIVDLGGGPNCEVLLEDESGSFVLKTIFDQEVKDTHAQSLAIARLDPFLPENDTRILTHKLLENGIAKPMLNGNYHAGGFDIDDYNRPRAAGGGVTPNIWFLGYPVEGAQYYTHALPRTGLKSRLFDEASCAVEEMFDTHEKLHPALKTREKSLV